MLASASEDMKGADEGWQVSLTHPESWWSAFQALSLTDREAMFKELSNATERFQIDSFRGCEALLNIWLSFLELHYEIHKNADETRTLYKYMKSNHLGNSSVEFYLQFAKMEQEAGNSSKAESVLKNGIESLKNNYQLCAALESLKVLGSFKFNSKVPSLLNMPSVVVASNVLMTPASMENMQSQESFAKPKVKRLGLTGPPKRVNPNIPTSPSHSQGLQLVLETPTPASPRFQKRTLIDSPVLKHKQPFQIPPKAPAVEREKSEPENDNSMSLTTIIVNPEAAAVSKTEPEEKENIEASKATSVKSRIIKMGNKSYRVLQMVGRGGSSKVYKVLSVQDSQIFALKKVSLRNLDDTTLSGYINEIDLLSKFKNAQTPFIIKLVEYELNREQGYLLILMECGESDLCRMLQERARSKFPTDYNFIRYYFSQMIQAVKIVHEAKIVHCDLKPANFLLVQGQLKLIDFGISKAIMNDTTNVLRENQVGTVNYMSPEALQETNCSTLSNSDTKGILKIGRPSDIWSLGCILFEMAFGRPPFAHLSLVQRLQRIMDPSVPIEYPQCDNADLIDCIRGCLIRAPKLRYSLDQLMSHPFLSPPSTPFSVGAEVALVRKEQIEELLRLFSERVPGIDTKHLSDRIFKEWTKK